MQDECVLKEKERVGVLKELVTVFATATATALQLATDGTATSWHTRIETRVSRLAVQSTHMILDNRGGSSTERVVCRACLGLQLMVGINDP